MCDAHFFLKGGRNLIDFDCLRVPSFQHVEYLFVSGVGCQPSSRDKTYSSTHYKSAKEISCESFALYKPST